ncbi:Crp/Fnr family transcriptional regulator [Intestinibacter sp.]|uniref:Crp/Fnr family transcriptional regulator n=1 Tax=Intestinibacter sp. TaxID=1965304 RepID=UPI002A749B51|nr:Crp/Fnr family transcriptional regulator [Intestinibacter sp.]MDY2735533.1 Crp/Fnr family transcriptional regulator [Intestinibacter sp.]MDY4575306.1 Crp/Fnr family transcriptional regulator [Intestinibacter sp.]
MDKIIKALAKSRPFHNLNEKALQEIAPLLKGTVKFFEKGSLLLDEGEYVDYIGIILSGKLAVSNFYSTGDESLVNKLEPSYSFGLEITCTYEKISPFSIYALTDSEVFIFNQDAIFKKGFIPEEYRSIILQDVLKFIANENMRKYYKIKIISHYKLRQKIIAYLLFEKQKHNSNVFTISYNREELSKYLCVNRSALSHELSAMQKEGLIKFDKNRFEIISINL